MEPDIARAEYETNGQEGLDQLLAALDGGFEGVGTALLEEPSALTKVVLARRSDVKFTGSLDPLSLLHALQATFFVPCPRHPLTPCCAVCKSVSLLCRPARQADLYAQTLHQRFMLKHPTRQERRGLLPLLSK